MSTTPNRDSIVDSLKRIADALDPEHGISYFAEIAIQLTEIKQILNLKPSKET